MTANEKLLWKQLLWYKYFGGVTRHLCAKFNTLQFMLHLCLSI